MKIPKETLFERIRNRLGPANAVKTILTLQKAGYRAEIAYMAVKEASELVDRYKLEARSAIRHLRVWEATEAVRLMMAPSRQQHGQMLARQARAASALYLDARRDYMDLVELSIAHCNATAMARLKGMAVND